MVTLGPVQLTLGKLGPSASAGCRVYAEEGPWSLDHGVQGPVADIGDC